jgi:hypothetical protein
MEYYVSNAENEELTKPFDLEEIQYALFQMEKNKACGPDGFPIEFYQTCWLFIKEDMLELFIVIPFKFIGHKKIEFWNYYLDS